MHALIVVAHPETTSLTHSIAAQIGEGVTASGKQNSFEIADLTAEGFDPTFNLTDLAMFRQEAPASADIATEQARIDRSDALVLVYPVYWWTMPGLLKGWIDRVFTNGWAYDDTADSGIVKKLQHLPVHLVAIGGADMRTYARHGYFGAMRLQIDHGIFGYCGAPVLTSELLIEQEHLPDTRMQTAWKIGRDMFSKAEKTDAA